jgi:hypothetical protein
VKRFWRTFRFLLSFHIWEEREAWTIGHAEALKAFMEGPVGKLLAQHLRSCSLQLNARAVQSGDMHECDRAGGFQYALAYLDSLSAHKDVPQTSMPDDGGSPEGVEEFLERMTP